MRGRLRGKLLPGAVSIILLINFVTVQTASASEECNVRHIADVVKTISILRKIENSLNALALAQADAIVDIATGVHTLDLYNDESGFYGPLGGLQKTTGKNEDALNNLDKSIRRLATFSTVEDRYGEIRENITQIIDAGYEVHKKLVEEEPAEATRIYAATTVVALNEARADAYTVMSNLEKPISLAGFRCK